MDALIVTGRDRSPRGRMWGRLAAVSSLVWALVLTVAGPATRTAEAAAQLTETAAPSAFADVLPELRDGVATELNEELSRYAISARLDPGTGTIGGEQHLEFVNATGGVLSEVYFRLFPNAEYYGEGGLTVAAVAVAGEPVTPGLSVVDTVLRVPLSAPLAAGDRVEITFSFVTTVPANTIGSYAIFNRATGAGTWTLADWYPILAGWEPDRGWRLDAPTSYGDPTFGSTALYDVSLSAPVGWRLVTSGSEVGEDTSSEAGWQTRRFVAGPVRDFSLVSDDDYVVFEAAFEGTTVRSFATPGREAAAQASLDAAVEALAVFGRLFGPYPYGELDLVETPLVGSLAVSWAGIVFFDGPGFYGATALDDPDLFAFVAAHELGHQWWAGIVGVNSNDHTFISEGLTNYVAVVWVAEVLGPDAERRILVGSIVEPYLALLASAGDMVADVPVEEGLTGRGPIWYGKSALGFLAIRQAIGDEAFFSALATIVETFAFRVAEPVDLLAAFEAASGREVDELWRFWFEAAGTTPADVEALLAA